MLYLSRSSALAAIAERLDDLDRVDLFAERAEHGRLIAAAGADLEHLVGRLRIELLGHVGDDERRRDGLRIADRQRHVEVGEVAILLRDQFMPRCLEKRFEDALVFDPLPC